MKAVSKAVLARIRGKGRGWVFSAKDFLDLGSRAAVDQALSRLAGAKKIRRLRRGIYDFPRISQIVGVVPPSGAKVAAALGRKLKGGLQVDPALAANSLGLSTQVPARQVYLTTGPSRTITAGGVVLNLKHAGATRMIGAGKPAGVVLQALRAVRPSVINNNDDHHHQVFDRLARTLPDKVFPQVQRDLQPAPVWVKKALAKIQAAKAATRG